VYFGGIMGSIIIVLYTTQGDIINIFNMLDRLHVIIVAVNSSFPRILLVDSIASGVFSLHITSEFHWREWWYYFCDWFWKQSTFYNYYLIWHLNQIRQGRPIARRGRTMSSGLKFLEAYIFFLCKVLY